MTLVTRDNIQPIDMQWLNLHDNIYILAFANKVPVYSEHARYTRMHARIHIHTCTRTHTHTHKHTQDICAVSLGCCSVCPGPVSEYSLSVQVLATVSVLISLLTAEW
jgi:hypothetical protein